MNRQAERDEDTTMANQTHPRSNRPPEELIAWLSFLAVDRLDQRDLLAVTAALAAEGPLAELTIIETRRTLAELSALDPVGLAEAWVAQRSLIDAGEQMAGTAQVVAGVLHRHDPVVVPGAWPDRPVITDRSIGDWVALRRTVTRLAGAEHAFEGEPAELRASLLDSSALATIDLRHRVARAPIVRAAVTGMVRAASPAELDRLGRTAAQLDPADRGAVDRWIDRLWLVAELKRLGRSVRPSDGGSRPSAG